MLLSELAHISQQISRTAGRLAKIELLAEGIRRLAREEVRIGINYLSGILPQGRIGIGFALLARVNGAAADAPSLTISEVDALLSDIAAATGRGSATVRSRLLGALFRRATGAEQDFLVRLIMGELRQGALEGVMVEAIARAAEVPVASIRRASMFSANLAVVAEAALTSGERGLAVYDAALFMPVAPMLAQPARDLTDALERLGHAALEWKLDGARIQLHKKGSEIRIFSRNLNDVTEAVPEVAERAREFGAFSLILDGEVLALHPDGSPYPFQATMRRFGRKLDIVRQRGLLPLHPFFFDCLYLDGRSLIQEPEEDRFQAMAATLPTDVVIPRLVTDNRKKGAAFLADVLTRGHEGIMAKAPSSLYEAGRRGFGWLKVKPVQTLDLVVLAAEWGHGRRKGFLSNLHLGARDEERGGFAMLGKTFKGMTDVMLGWQTARLLELETGRDIWTVYVRPELMVEVAFSDIQASPRYPAGYALRFARVKRYRPDKTPEEADTLATVREMFSLQSVGVRTSA